MTTLDYISHSSQMTIFCEGPDSAKRVLAPACEVPLRFWRITGACAPVLMTGGLPLPLHLCNRGQQTAVQP